ncbi:replication factor C large subunit [archaeon]|nr:replication factor C large subunit [archaeon]
MDLYTVKYAPKSSSEIYGQQKAVSELKDFIKNYKTQSQKATLIYGPIGVGKTSSVYALAKELDYDLLEINSSDIRNQANMNSFLNSVLGQQSLFFKPKLILIDEIDALSGVKDRGAIPALTKAITNSSFPVIITANDPYNQKLKPLRKTCKLIEFQKLPYQIISDALQHICEQEQIKFEEKALNSLARQVDGDLRGALIDLQICSTNKTFIFQDTVDLSDRKRTETIINALRVIFKSTTVDNALPALNDLDIKLNEVFLWMDANLPKEYLDPVSLARAYEYLSKADVFNGRIRRQQHWRFLVYIYNLLTAGISSAKEQRNPNFTQYKPTMRLLRIWQANMKQAKKKDIAEKLAQKTHTSKKIAVQQIPYFQAMFRKQPNLELAEELELSKEEVDWLRK